MYLPFFIILLFTVLIAPALALSPRMLQNPTTALAIPMVSIFVVVTFAMVAVQYHFYSHGSVLTFIIILSLIAILRSWHFSRRNVFAWTRQDCYLLVINISLLLSFIAAMGYSSFSQDDAMGTWNSWAIAHYFQNSITLPPLPPYPQFFSYLISFCYKLFGTLEYQGPIKALLFIFPLTNLNAVAFKSKKTFQLIWFYLLLVFFCKAFNNRFYEYGYADPMMVASLAAAAVLFISYLEKNNRYYLWLSVLCGITASLSKQPGLLWVWLTFPSMLMLRWWQRKTFDWQELLAIIVLALPALLWLLGPGWDFTNNAGVVDRSFAGRTFAQQIVFAFITMLRYPQILVLLLLAACTGIKNKINLQIFILFIVPAAVIWLLFANYDGLRLGLHVLMMSGILIASADYFAPYWYDKIKIFTILANWTGKYFRKIAQITVLLAATGFVITTYSQLHSATRNYPLQGGRSVLNEYYGPAADFVYQNLYDRPDIKLWVRNIYIIGEFFGRTKLIYGSTVNNGKQLFQELATDQPDYLLDSVKLPDGTENALTDLLQHCPKTLTLLTFSNQNSFGKYSYQIYKINKQFLTDKFCQL